MTCEIHGHRHGQSRLQQWLWHGHPAWSLTEADDSKWAWQALHKHGRRRSRGIDRTTATSVCTPIWQWSKGRTHRLPRPTKWTAHHRCRICWYKIPTSTAWCFAWRIAMNFITQWQHWIVKKRDFLKPCIKHDNSTTSIVILSDSSSEEEGPQGMGPNLRQDPSQPSPADTSDKNCGTERD